MTLPEHFEKSIDSKGFLEILFHLKDAPHSFTELTEKLPYSRATISTRLNEALKLKLIEPKWAVKGRMRVRWKYQLSEAGERLLETLGEVDFLEAQKTIRLTKEKAIEAVEKRKLTSS